MRRVSVREAYNIREKKATGFFEDGLVYSGEPVQPRFLHVGDDETWKLYVNNEWLFATINRIIDDVTQVRFEIVPKDKTKKIEGKLKNRIDIIKKFFENPNDNKESFREVREKFLRDLMVYGRGAMEKVVIDGKLREVYALPANQIKVRVDKHGNLYKNRTYKQDNPIAPEDKPVYFEKDEIIFLVLKPSSKSLYGVKPIDVIANSVAADLLRASYNSNYLINGAEASGILTVPGLSRTDLRRFREYWEARFKGADKAHRTFITNSKDLKWVRMALTNKDMEFSEYGKEIRNKIFATYNMQPFIMGIVDDTTGKLNSEQQAKIYKMGALRPILVKEAYAYTKEIIEEGFGFDDIMVSFSQVDLEDAKTEANIDAVDLQNGVIVINERRSKLGMPPTKWGDTPMNLMPGGGQVNAQGQNVSPRNQGASNTNPNPPDKKPPKPQQKSATDEKELFDKYVDLFVKAFEINPEKAFKHFTGTNLLLVFENEEVKRLFLLFTTEIKLLHNCFSEEEEMGKSLIDNAKKSIFMRQEYLNCFC